MGKKRNYTEQQLAIIRRKYAEKEKQGTYRDKFPDKFPFWARLKLYKNRTTLVIDEKQEMNDKTHKVEDSFVHREATHTQGHGERIEPNPDKSDPRPMYLRSPRVLPQRLFKPHNKKLDMPESLKKKYEKNNHKGNDKKE